MSGELVYNRLCGGTYGQFFNEYGPRGEFKHVN